MHKVLLIGLATALISVSAYAGNGLITIKSQSSVTKTADTFIQIAESKGLNVFSRINHSANAAKNGMELRPTELVLFGNPKIGTPLMNCSHSVAIDLPQKLLVSEDENGDVWLTYNDPAYLKHRHNIEGCDKVLEKVTKALNTIVNQAAQ